MKKRKPLIIWMVAGALILGLFTVFACTRISVYTTYQPFSGRLFDIDPSELAHIAVMDGTTGEKIDYTEPEDVSRFISVLNDLRYRYWVPMLPVSKGGWSHRLLFYGQDGMTDFYYGDNWLQFNGITYCYDSGLVQLFADLPAV